MRLQWVMRPLGGICLAPPLILNNPQQQANPRKQSKLPISERQCAELPRKAVSGHFPKLPDLASLLTPLSFQLNLQLNSEEGDLTSFVMNGEWAILGKARKDPLFSFCRLFQLFLDLLWI